MLTTDHRFTLEKGSKKHACPACDKKRFVRYIDQQTGAYLSPAVGRCDRQESCGYHFTPREHFDAGGARPESEHHAPPRPEAPRKTYVVPPEYMRPTLGRYDENALVSWLATLPGWNADRAERAALRYHVGTARNNYDGCPIFWQVDAQERIRTGKIIRYDPTTGRRVKDQKHSYNFTTKLLQNAGRLPDNFELLQCLFGAHLLRSEPQKPVAIVESEKTAIIASEYMPEMLWLACGSLTMISHAKQMNGLKYHILDAVKGRDVVLFPDAGSAYREWQAVAVAYRFGISDILERSEAEQGSDIADYLIPLNVEEMSSPVEAQHGAQELANYDYIDPATGEVFDYPPEWDNVALPDRNSPEYAEMLRYEAEAAPELPELPISDAIKADPLLATIIDVFDAVPE